ncbi:MAG TPA: M23 family metallopeptidase, partial [Helicobacteraceae bacterium]|nr:M23 family metallopeptidase [Helicobacteraceae bacterium]
KYGTYTDPIYNIKIFNESVSLKSTTPNAKVKNVLNGKVILATSNPILENIVIVEHANGLHTIYAHLDKIAPTIKKGKRIKKGSIIGRVNSELMFEVTQKNYHINPMQLIH